MLAERVWAKQRWVNARNLHFTKMKLCSLYNLFVKNKKTHFACRKSNNNNDDGNVSWGSEQNTQIDEFRLFFLHGTTKTHACNDSHRHKVKPTKWRFLAKFQNWIECVYNVYIVVAILISNSLVSLQWRVVSSIYCCFGCCCCRCM